MASRVTYPIACFPALDRVGGYEALLVRYEGAVANTTYLTQALHGNLSCGLPPDDAFHIMRGLDSAYPWPGLTLGLTLLAAYYFCANQVSWNPLYIYKADPLYYDQFCSKIFAKVRSSPGTAHWTADRQVVRSCATRSAKLCRGNCHQRFV